MKLTWAPPTTENDAVIYRATMTMEMREIRGHPDRFKADIGDTYQGISVVRDASIPMNEIHVVEGGRVMVMRFSETSV